ncbi:MAG TPA: hypothetical protein VGR18_09625 [Rubrobacter sp.]|nr:hypothetical protein [Rubrobacter sp.]
MEGIAVVVLLVAGIGVVAFALWVFVGRDGYADVEESSDSVEHAHLRRVAEAAISSLAPGAMRFAEKERGAGGVADLGEPARKFWLRFAAASAALERDPGAALRELRGLPGLLEEALRTPERETVVADDMPRRRTDDDARR